jgi:hypothetical protein
LIGFCGYLVFCIFFAKRVCIWFIILSNRLFSVGPALKGRISGGMICGLAVRVQPASLVSAYISFLCTLLKGHSPSNFTFCAS